MPRSDLPFGSEFSPAQIGLPVLLEFAHEYAADWKAFEEAVCARYFSEYQTGDYNKRKLANNTKLSMRAYGLIEADDTTLTETGASLYALRNDPQALYEAFGRHILKTRQGMIFVQCILDMHAAVETIDLNKLRAWLQERGIAVPRGGKHMSTLRLWLEKGGVFVSGYRVDQARLGSLLGLGMDEFEELAAVSIPPTRPSALRRRHMVCRSMKRTSRNRYSIHFVMPATLHLNEGRKRRDAGQNLSSSRQPKSWLSTWSIRCSINWNNRRKRIFAHYCASRCKKFGPISKSRVVTRGVSPWKHSPSNSCA